MNGNLLMIGRGIEMVKINHKKTIEQDIATLKRMADTRVIPVPLQRFIDELHNKYVKLRIDGVMK